MKNNIQYRYFMQLLSHQTYLHTQRYKASLQGWKSGLLLILVNFLAPGSGSVFATRIRIQESQINADPDPKHCAGVYITLQYRTVLQFVFIWACEFYEQLINCIFRMFTGTVGRPFLLHYTKLNFHTLQFKGGETRVRCFVSVIKYTSVLINLGIYHTKARVKGGFLRGITVSVLYW